MFNLELCLVFSISSNQFLHEIIDIVLPEFKFPYFMILEVTSTDYVPSTQDKGLCQAVCSNSDRVCPLLLAWVSQSLGVI